MNLLLHSIAKAVAMSHGYCAFVCVGNDLLALVKLLHQSIINRILICGPLLMFELLAAYEEE